MNQEHESAELQKKRHQAAKTAWVLGAIALGVFVMFIAMAVVGR